DLLSMDAVELQSCLKQGKLTSVRLVKAGLDQIRKEDRNGLNLNSMISTAPEDELLKTAAELDSERAEGNIRSPLHGITIIVKDAIATHPDLKMKTSCGSHALISSIVPGDARVIEKQTSRGDNITTGWSAVGGQTTSAYVRGGIRYDQGSGGPSMPGGSSTGSAVGVSAGYSPLSLGTETDGSTIQPANRASLFAIKPTHDIISLDGVWQLSTSFDVIGCIAKSSSDLANLLDVVVEDSSSEFHKALTKSFRNLKLGFVDPDVWRFPDRYSHPIEGVREQMKKSYLDAIFKIKKLAAKIEYPLSIPLPDDLNLGGKSSFFTTITYEYGPLVDSYLKNLVESEVRSLNELIAWNKMHASLELPKEYPSQARLIAARDKVPSREDYEAVKSHFKKVTANLGKVFEDHDIDIIAIPTDSRICSLTSVSGFPIGTIPLGYLDYNSKPYGLAVLARAGDDGLLLQFMSAFEAVFPKRQVPPR
ncbi:hypothetical protein OIDMADRAFT_70515, partial [Oidiodendron maius Zn]